jgi:hypothetical protein
MSALIGRTPVSGAHPAVVASADRTAVEDFTETGHPD